MRSLCYLLFVQELKEMNVYTSMVSSQHGSPYIPFLKILASPAPLNFDLYLFMLLSAWTPHFHIVFRKYFEAKGWNNNGAHLMCFYSVKDHSSALPVLRSNSCLWWQSYFNMSYSVIERSESCSFKILLCIVVILI